MPAVADDVARKYVLALVEIAQEQNQVEEIGDSLRGLQEVMAEVPELLATLSHPGLGDEQKHELLTRALGERPPTPVSGFLDLLIRDERAGILQQAADLYKQLCDQLQGVGRAYVETVLPLSSEQQVRLRAALEMLVEGRVVIEERINREIGAGLRISIGDARIDASTMGRLGQMRETIQQARVAPESAGAVN